MSEVDVIRRPGPIDRIEVREGDRVLTFKRKIATGEGWIGSHEVGYGMPEQHSYHLSREEMADLVHALQSI